MSTNVLPTLKGLGWPVIRTPQWNTSVQRTISGKRTAVALMSTPLRSWELVYNYLKADSPALDYQTLYAFFNTLQGQFDTFLYEDPTDNSVTTQALGTGNGVNDTFPLVRAVTGVGYSYVERILAPKAVSKVYVDGVEVSAADYTVTSWGATNPGLIIFDAGKEPGNGLAVTATFTYYWPVCLTEDSLDFSNFMLNLHRLPSIKFMQVK